MKKVHQTENITTEVAEGGKYYDKKGWKSCPRQYKVCILKTSFHIMVFCTIEKHCHEEDPNYDTKTNYHWTS